MQGVRWGSSASTVVALSCKECGGTICEHGRRRSRCKECGGCINMRARSSALSVQGVRWVHQSASTVVGASRARSAVGINMRARSSALSVQGVRWGINLRARSSALSVQGVRWGDQYASTVVGALQCKECGGASICEHGRRRLYARSAVGHKYASTVVALRCKECGGSQICEHGRRRDRCKECDA